MKIIQVVEKLDIGGLEKIVLELSNYFSKDHKVLIISIKDFDKEKINNWIKINDSVKIKCLHKNTEDKNKVMKILNIIKMIVKMRKIINKFNPDIIHTHHIGPLFYSSLASVLRKNKLIHTDHDTWYLKEKKNFELRKKIYKLKPHETVALSNGMQDELNNIYKIKNTSVVFNGIDLDKLKEVVNAKEILKIKEEFVIGSCGRIESVKNHEYLINQAKNLKDVRFIIAGSGSLLNKLKATAPDNVTFLGHQDDLSLFFSAIDVFCLPSKNEGLPLSILEAYYYNKPVFCTDVGNIKEIICSKDHFLNTKKNLDIKNIKKIEKEITINMKENIINYFSLDSMAKNYLLRYKESLL